MRRIKNTALLGAFAAITGVAAVSHEAGAAQFNYAPQTYAEEVYKTTLSIGGNPTNNTIKLTPNVTVSQNNNIVLTLQNATFTNEKIDIGPYNQSYSCQGQASTGATSATLTCSGGSLYAGTSYVIGDDNNGVVGSSISITPTNTNPAILTYNAPSEVASVTLTSVSQQLAVQPISNSNYAINPANLSQFSVGGTSASNFISFSNYANGASPGWLATITSGSLNFVFNGIPSSVTSISGVDSGYTSYNNTVSSSSFANGSATVSIQINNTNGLLSMSSDTYTFTFSNSGNIQPANITVGPIFGLSLNSSYSYTYQSGTQPFMTWTLGGIQIYVPDALVPDNNAIEAGYITISMPSSASIANVQILNSGTGVSCNISNSSLTSTGLANQYYLDLSKLPSLCTGVPASAWQGGVPLVINISAPNGVATNQVAADGYAVIKAFGLKRLPVDIVNTNIFNYSAFSY